MEKEKKMIIILSITSGVLLLLLLISSGYNYKQYNDNNTCTTTSKNLNSTSQNVQSGLAALQTKLATSETNLAALQTKLSTSETNLAALQTKLSTSETNLASLQNSQSEKISKQQSQLKELINVMSSKNSDKAAGMPTPDQIDCLLKQVYQKYTPFDILYNIISFIFASASEMVVENKGTSPWSSSVVSTLVDMRNVGCSSVQKCNIPSSSDFANSCKQPFN